PLRSVSRQQRLDRDRRPRAQPRPLGNPDRPPQPARSDRPVTTPPSAPDPRPPDADQPTMDPPDARPLALAKPVHHRPEHDPGTPRAHLSTPRARRGPADPTAAPP